MRGWDFRRILVGAILVVVSQLLYTMPTQEEAVKPAPEGADLAQLFVLV